MKSDAADIASLQRSAAGAPPKPILATTLLGIAIPLALIAGVAYVAVGPARAFAERTMASTWHRAVEADPSLIHALGEGDNTGSALHPASTGDSARVPVIGERVTLVAPDGSIRTLRVCDPASPSSTASPDCLNAYLSRAVPPTTPAVRQRSL